MEVGKPCVQIANKPSKIASAVENLVLQVLQFH
jgi:hypothetical protein